MDDSVKKLTNKRGNTQCIARYSLTVKAVAYGPIEAIESYADPPMRIGAQSFVQAAERLNLPRPTVANANAVRRQEKQLGVRIFVNRLAGAPGQDC